MSRLTRKEIKRDEVLETLTSIMHWLGDNSRNILVGLGVVLLLILAGAAYYGYRQGREAEAGELLAEAVDVLAAPAGPGADGAGGGESFVDERARAARGREILDQVRSDFSGTSAARIARVYLGELAASEGSYEVARDHWESFLEGREGDMLASTVKVNLMSLDRLEGRGQDLITRLREEVESGSSSLPQDVLLYQLALTQEHEGDTAGARDTWSRLADEHPMSPFAQEARSRSGDAGLLPEATFPGA